MSDGLDLDPDLRRAVPHPRPFICEVVASADDASRAVNHVSNVEYLRWIDRAAELHADALGYTRRRMLEEGIMWFVARHEIDYLAEAVPGDRLMLSTWVRDVRRVKSWRDTLIYRPRDRTLICRAATLWVLVDLDRRRPMSVDGAMAACLDPLLR